MSVQNIHISFIPRSYLCLDLLLTAFWSLPSSYALISKQSRFLKCSVALFQDRLPKRHQKKTCLGGVCKNTYKMNKVKSASLADTLCTQIFHLFSPFLFNCLTALIGRFSTLLCNGLHASEVLLSLGRLEACEFGRLKASQNAGLQQDLLPFLTQILQPARGLHQSHKTNSRRNLHQVRKSANKI